MPGRLAYLGGNDEATGAGETPGERFRMFEADGLVRLTRRSVNDLPSGAFIVSLHQDADNDFHLRRLDVDGWSEKRGDHPVENFRPRPWFRLLHSRGGQGPYWFAGFFYCVR